MGVVWITLELVYVYAQCAIVWQCITLLTERGSIVRKLRWLAFHMLFTGLYTGFRTVA